MWASGPPGRRAVAGRGPRAAGPSGRRAAGPRRAVGSGPLGRGPAFSKTRSSVADGEQVSVVEYTEDKLEASKYFH